MPETEHHLEAIRRNTEAWEFLGQQLLREAIEGFYRRLTLKQRGTPVEEKFRCIFNEPKAHSLSGYTRTLSRDLVVTFYSNSSEVDIKGEGSDSSLHICAESSHRNVKFLDLGVGNKGVVAELDSYSRFNIARSFLDTFAGWLHIKPGVESPA